MAITWKKLAYEDDVVLESDFTAAGDLIVGSGVGTASEAMYTKTLLMP